jgi:hypothetical protein
MVLVQSEGRLLAYLLETLVQSSSSESTEGKGQQGPQKVSGNREINFFKVGRVGARTLVVYAKKEGVNGTVLKAMEPMAVIERARAQNSRFLGMGSKKSEWFRLHKVGFEVTLICSRKAYQVLDRTAAYRPKSLLCPSLAASWLLELPLDSKFSISKHSKLVPYVLALLVGCRVC